MVKDGRRDILNLEGTLWNTFHFTFGAELLRQLAPRLRPRYLALPVERLVLEETSDLSVTTAGVYPDVGVLPIQSGQPDPSSGAEVSYFVFLSRVERRPVLDIRPIALDQPLPVPLLAGDADMLLDLQAAFMATYNLLGYDLLIDYHRSPTPTLAPEQAQ